MYLTCTSIWWINEKKYIWTCWWTTEHLKNKYAFCDCSSQSWLKWLNINMFLFTCVMFPCVLFYPSLCDKFDNRTPHIGSTLFYFEYKETWRPNLIIRKLQSSLSQTTELCKLFLKKMTTKLEQSTINI